MRIGEAHGWDRVDRTGSIVDPSGGDFLRLENLDVDIPGDGDAVLPSVRFQLQKRTI
jgi:hypothetical protein